MKCSTFVYSGVGLEHYPILCRTMEKHWSNHLPWWKLRSRLYNSEFNNGCWKVQSLILHDYFILYITQTWLAACFFEPHTTFCNNYVICLYLILVFTFCSFLIPCYLVSGLTWLGLKTDMVGTFSCTSGAHGFPRTSHGLVT